MLIIQKLMSSKELSLTSSDYTSEESSDDDILAKDTNHLFQNHLEIIQSLKFKNMIFKPGDHISLRLDPRNKKLVYGTILLIGKIKEAKFPILLIAWLYSKFDGFVGDAPEFLANRQLVMTNHQQWQYAESIVQKISVLTLKQYEELDYRERQNPCIFFSRSYLLVEKKIPEPTPDTICFCLKPYNPDHRIEKCILCELYFHKICARSAYLCLQCR